MMNLPQRSTEETLRQIEESLSALVDAAQAGAYDGMQEPLVRLAERLADLSPTAAVTAGNADAIRRIQTLWDRLIMQLSAEQSGIAAELASFLKSRKPIRAYLDNRS